MSFSLATTSDALEQALVALNPRGMQLAREYLQPGYMYRAAQMILDNKGVVFIGTGFPVANTFETDGPVGAIYLYLTLKNLGFSPIIVCSDPLFSELSKTYHCISMPLGRPLPKAEIAAIMDEFKPSLICSIERPGRTTDASYRNMRGVDISAHCGQFDDFCDLASCPVLAIGDGGNEIGMGNIAEHLTPLDVSLSTTTCDELLVADVSNWAVYGLLAMLGALTQQKLLDEEVPLSILIWLSERGSVDGVTKVNTLTEDSLPYDHARALIKNLNELTKQYWK